MSGIPETLQFSPYWFLTAYTLLAHVTLTHEFFPLIFLRNKQQE
jgi:hypothetical protein